MKKYLFIIILLVLITGSGSASAKKKKEFVDGNYSRNSISFIVVNHGDSYDRIVNDAVRSYSNDKFDFNDIDIKTVNIAEARLIDPSELTKVPYKTKVIEEQLRDAELGKSIVSYWLNRTPDGRMNETRVLERGRRNATDQDVKNALATKIGREMIAESGYGLIDRSYIIVLDAFAVGTYSGKGQLSGSKGVSVTAIVYAIDMQENTLDRLFSKGWIYNDDDATIASKVEYYNKLKIPVKKRITINEGAYSKEKNLTHCIHEAINSILDNKKMKEWKVASPVLQVHPMQSKIGKKEGVRNGQRFSVYRYVEDKNGELQSKEIGKVRAANKIVDNRGEASGETQPSTFYQISGRRVQPGMLLFENKDLKLKLGVGGQIGGGIAAGFDVGLNYLAWLNTFGGSRFTMSHYALGDFVTGLNAFTVGYGCGIRLIRNIELMPYIKTAVNKSFALDGGLGINLQIAAPIDISLRIGGNNFPKTVYDGDDDYSVTEAGLNGLASMPMYFTIGLRFNL